MESSVAYQTGLHVNESLPIYGINISNEETTTTVDIDKFVRDYLGEKRKDIFSAVVLSVVYSFIFITGIVGNLSTCLVIGKNAYMHSVTNYYLLNLAVSDMLILILGKYMVRCISTLFIPTLDTTTHFLIMIISLARKRCSRRDI